MYEAEVRAALRDLPLSGLRIYARTTSTNDEAMAWAAHGAADLSLVVADEQTAGRGRAGNHWYTAAGRAIACSVILRPTGQGIESPSRLAGLGAVAVAEACADLGLRSAIKWPNDILVDGRKIAGVLVETSWTGDILDASILGIGINVRRDALPDGARLSFPATNLDAELGRRAERADFLRAVVSHLLVWRPKLDSEEFLKSWESRLAFVNQMVVLKQGERTLVAGTLAGLETDGSLRLVSDHEPIRVQMGAIHLIPTDDRIG